MTNRITMVTPAAGSCGIGDTTALLNSELANHVEISHVTDAANFLPEMNDVDLVHIQHQYFLFGGVAPWKNRFAAFLPRVKRPIVLTAHEFVEPTGSLLVRWAIGRTNRLQFESNAIRRILVHTALDRKRLAQHGVPADKLALVRLGVPEAPELPDAESAKLSFGWSERFIVTLFGFVSRRKGHRVALQALHLLPESVHLVIAGGQHADDRTSLMTELRASIESEGLSDRVTITGFLPDEEMHTVMAATDLVVAPFTESSGSASLAYALSCGKPIVASDIAPHREINSESAGTLRLFASEDVEAMASKIRECIQRADLREQLAHASAEYALEHSYEQMAAQTFAVYRDVLDYG